MPRAKVIRLGAAFFGAIALAAACTENPETRVIDDDPSPDTGGGGTSGSGARPTGGTSMGGTGTGGTSTGGTDGGPGPDTCLENCADPDACTVEEQALVDACHRYVLRCLDQPADVMRDRDDTPVEAGPVAPATPSRPQLTPAEADALYSVEAALRAGGEYTATYSGSGEGGESGAGGEGGGPGGEPLGERTVSYEFENDWDPTGPIEDEAKIVPGYVVDPDGNRMEDGTFQTIQSAISDAVNVAGCPRIFIKVLPGTYREKITVPAKTSTPPITLYSADRDPSKVVIVAGYSAAGDQDAECRSLTVHQSATFTNSLPQPFQARNLTIANDYVAGTCPSIDPDEQTAVALLTQADKALFDNVRVLGHRNALYVKSTSQNQAQRAYFRNCYIEGDEDMILGRGVAVIDQSRVHSLGDRVSGGAISAPSTRVDNPHGILIINSELTADARVSDVLLGNPWFEQVSTGDTEAVGKTIVRNSILGAHIRAVDPWAPTVRETPQNPTPAPRVLYTSDDYYRPMTGLVPPEVYLAEFGNSGPGAAQ
ncbi:MAG TPA: pectinesterase family protein [Polyangiaceae bacterium]